MTRSAAPVERGGVVGVGDGDRAQAGGARRLETPLRILDRDAVGLRRAWPPHAAEQQRHRAQIRIGRRLAGGRVLGGDDRA